MISDSIPKASVAMASSNAREFSKKKRGNRSAKLKQCKLDARREQWLSQVKCKSGLHEVTSGRWDVNGDLVYLDSEKRMPLGKLELKRTDQKLLNGSGSPEHHFTDLEFSPLNSPTSHGSSIMGSNDSMRISVRSGSSSSSSCGFSSSGMSVEDYGDAPDDDCLDDWEIMADALAAAEVKQQEQHGEEINSHLRETTEKQSEGADVVKVNRCAWRPDDAFRPRSLPNLSKQYTSMLNNPLWGSVNLGHAPTSCPICCEDLDRTDSSFSPCSCGFRLCLFCHKRILEDDGRCPGCRKQYAYLPVDNEASA